MILDNLLHFTGTSNGASAGIAYRLHRRPTTGTPAASNIVDLGLNGLPASASGGGARDIGVGDDPGHEALRQWSVVAFTVGTSLQLQLQGAPDDSGSGGQGSYTTMWTSGPLSPKPRSSPVPSLPTSTFPCVVYGQVLRALPYSSRLHLGRHPLDRNGSGAGSSLTVTTRSWKNTYRCFSPATRPASPSPTREPAPMKTSSGQGDSPPSMSTSALAQVNYVPQVGTTAAYLAKQTYSVDVLRPRSGYQARGRRRRHRGFCHQDRPCS